MKDKYYHSKESVDEYIKLAKEVNSRQLIGSFTKYLDKGSSILEIGSGPGTDWKILSDYYKVVGSDYSTEFLNRLKINNPTGIFFDLDAITLKINKKFDGIYSNKVLHHLNDKELKDSISRQVEILNTDGLICHSFWKGKGSEIFHGLYVNYQTESTLKKYFDILVLEEYREFEDNDSLILIGRKITTI